MSWPDAFCAVGVTACFAWMVVRGMREVRKP